MMFPHTISSLRVSLAKKECSAEEVVRSYLDRIKAHDGAIHSVLGTDASAIEQAKKIDQKRAAGEEVPDLAGIPILIKDNMMMQGWNVTAGSRMLERHVATYTSTAIERLQARGMIMLGRANMDEFAMGSSTESSYFGATKNPWDLTRVPGGTSGGSTAAVAADFAPAALGSDTGGSVRQPASLCGVVGLKPTYGRISRYGLIAMASSLDQIGPVTHTIEDTAILFNAMAGKDPKDATTVAIDAEEEPKAPATVKGMKLGLPKEFFVEGMDDEVRARIMEAVKKLEEQGAIIEEVSMPHMPVSLAAYYVIMPCELASNLGRFDGIRYGHHVSKETLSDLYTSSRSEGFAAETRRRIILGTFALSAGYADQYYRKALQVRELIKQDFAKVFARVDALITPTSPCVAWKLGERFSDPLAMYLADICTVSANLSGVPALSLPCGFAHHLPVGLQLMAKPFAESTLFRVGSAYQAVTDWHTKAPSIA